MLINPQYTTIAAVGILLLGILVGAITARLVLPSRRQLRRLTSELESLRAEHATYRGNVTKHFETTSELVANMTASYKAVYDHLATGAQSLCDGSKALEEGQFGAPRLVFDQRVDVERLDAGSAHARGEQPDVKPATAPVASEPSSRSESREAPVLEMTRATTADAPTTDDAATREDDTDSADRPSIH
jgi:hypothetical protein